jgi:hypothetical protein
VLPDAVRARVTSVLAEWDGADPSLHDRWLERAESVLHPCSRPAARVALLSALAPYRIEEATVADFRRVWPAERDLVAAVAWGAFAAARRIGSWLVPAGRTITTGGRETIPPCARGRSRAPDARA